MSSISLPLDFQRDERDGDSLVVTTDMFTRALAWMAPRGPRRQSGRALQSVEGWEAIDVASTWTDPDVYKTPYQYSWTYERIPENYTVSFFHCDPRPTAWATIRPAKILDPGSRASNVLFKRVADDSDVLVQFHRCRECALARRILLPQRLPQELTRISPESGSAPLDPMKELAPPAFTQRALEDTEAQAHPRGEDLVRTWHRCRRRQLSPRRQPWMLLQSAPISIVHDGNKMILLYEKRSAPDARLHWS